MKIHSKLLSFSSLEGLYSIETSQKSTLLVIPYNVVVFQLFYWNVSSPRALVDWNLSEIHFNFCGLSKQHWYCI